MSNRDDRKWGSDKDKGFEDDWMNFGFKTEDDKGKSEKETPNSMDSWSNFEGNTKTKKDSKKLNPELSSLWGAEQRQSKLQALLAKYRQLSRRTKIIIVTSTVLVFGGIFTTTVLVSLDKELPKEQTSVYELNNVNADINSANIENLNKFIQTSYLGKEWEYFNKIEIREQFYTKVLGTVSFKVDKGVSPLDKSIPVTITSIDWVKVTNDMRDFDFETIQSKTNELGIKKENYEFHKELTNLFCSYIVGVSELPLKQTKITLEMNYTKNDGKYSWSLVDDSLIDNLLFASDEFHTALDVFGGIATGDIGTLEVNPNWTKWQETYTSLEAQLEQEKLNLENFNKIVTNDNGTVLHINKNGQIENVINLNGDKSKSNEDESVESKDKTETDLDKAKSQRNGTSDNKDENDESTKDRKQTYEIKAPIADNTKLNIVNAIVNQLDIMKQNEPLHTYIKPLTSPNPEWEAWNVLDEATKAATPEPPSAIEVPLQKHIPYKWIGAYYLMNEYKENGKKKVVIPEFGDGTMERPFGFETPVVTKMIGVDGQYHDVRVTLNKVVRDQEAIEYAVSFDERNRGFDLSSERSLMAVEFTVENLEGADIDVQSEFTLTTQDVNLISRTGTMYNFKERAVITPKQSVVMQDWFYTPKIDDTYLVWGKSYERKMPVLWYRQLQLEGEGQKK